MVWLLSGSAVLIACARIVGVVIVKCDIPLLGENVVIF
jgi:hypothetical protein